MNIKGNIQVVVAIVVGALIIGGAIMLSSKQQPVNNNVANTPEAPKITEPRAVTAEDHIRGGNMDSKVKVVEYSDIECPYCKRFHSTTSELTKKYGDKVAFVYRHFPLTQLHDNAVIEAHATECAAELGGNEKFWQYLDRIYELTSSNDGLDLAKLPVIAKEIGLDEAKFNECQKSGKFMNKIQESAQEAFASGAQGTPFTVIFGPNNQNVIIKGAQSTEFVEKAINDMLAK